MKYIPQLIGHTFGITYLDNHVVVGVAIYPVIDAADLDVVLQFNRESSVILAYGKLGALYLEGSNMMGCDNLWFIPELRWFCHVVRAVAVLNTHHLYRHMLFSSLPLSYC